MDGWVLMNQTDLNLRQQQLYRSHMICIWMEINESKYQNLNKEPSTKCKMIQLMELMTVISDYAWMTTN